MYGADPYANYLFKKYNKIMMTAFPLLTREEMNAILDYCDNEAIKYPMPATTTAVLDSGNVQAVNFCGYDTIYYPLADTIIKPFPVVSATDSVSNTPYQPPVYEFNIDRSGWYNVDCFINTYENAALLSKVNLSASLKMSKQAYIQVYLCIPTRKLLTYGNESGKKKYTFENSDGSISLIKNDEAFIFVIGADTTSAYYGITKFLVKDNQDIIVNVKASTKEEILNAIKRNKLDSLKIDIEKPETYIIQALVNDTAKKGGPAENMQMQIMERPCIGDSFKMKRTGDLFQ